MKGRYATPFALSALLALLVAILGGTRLSVSERPIASAETRTADADEFPSELVSFTPYAKNPVFKAQGPGHWDVKIRERGWILLEGGLYHLWYTGYDGTREGIKQLGYAKSSDGISWTPSPDNPLLGDRWIEDMTVVKEDDTYYMFAEGPQGRSYWFTAKDYTHWHYEGLMDIRDVAGKPITSAPCGTPTVYRENGTWYLFYEKLDLGVWLATSKDLKVWTNVQDAPVLVPGPDAYDKSLIAVDQVIKQGGAYYAYYHGSGVGTPRTWNTNVARSEDLVHWRKYPGNPIVDDNKSSGVVVFDGRQFRLYTMHEQVDLFLPRPK